MSQARFDNIKVILAGTTHAGNIGASARAMKTMGLHVLRLVDPREFPCAESTARAAGADDILTNAVIYESLADAVGDCKYVYGTSARRRSLQCEVMTPESAAREIHNAACSDINTAIVFGRERTGLTNKELDLCNKMIKIPSNQGFSSLNLASAVQIMGYEILKAAASIQQDEIPGEAERAPVDRIQLARFYEHLEQCLVEIEFLDREKPKRLMRRLKQLFNRTSMDQNEYNIMRGILTAIQEKIRQK